MPYTTNAISILVKNQLPDFYKTEGPRFIAFLEAYYEWMELENQTIGYSRNLFSIRDVDTTLDQFLNYFRDKYLVGAQLKSSTSSRDLIKHAVEIYRSKGTSKAVQLLFLLLFNESVDVYYPGDDVLRPSDGTWVVPKYIELTKSDLSFTYVNKTVIGSISGATALVERVDRRNINGKVIDIAYISNVVGLFTTGERIVDLSTGVVDSAPEMVGSLTTVDILSPGRNFSVGDIVDITSLNLGQGAKARVAKTTDATGRVDFTIADGGTGYATTANVLISERNLRIIPDTLSYANSAVTSFEFREIIRQTLANITFTSANTTFLPNQNVEGRYANGVVKATGTVLQVSGNVVTVQQTGSNDFTSTVTLNVNNTAGAVITTVVDRTAQGILVGSNSTHLGVTNIIRPFIANGRITSLTTQISANIDLISSGQDAMFSIGQLSDTEQVFLNTDLIGANNVSNVPYLSLSLTASSYNFPKRPTGNLSSILSQVLNINTFTLGTIATLTGINPGAGYNQDPFVKIVNDYIAPFQRKNLLLQISNTTGNFINGESLIQQYTQETYVINLTSPNGTFQTLETVRQVQANTNVVLGSVLSYNPANSTLIVISDKPYDATANVVGLTSNATSAVANVVAGTDDVVTKGTILASNSTTITLKRTRFATSFADGVSVTGDTSGATAYVTSVSQINDSLAMGNNAIIDASAGTANGVIVSIDITDSGFAYNDGEIVTISSSNNTFIGTGIARLTNQGTSEGYWTSSRGFLNNKYLHDSDYYQDYSYEIRAGISLDQYASVVKQLVHVAGTKFFGRVEEDVAADTTMSASLSVTTS